MHAADQIDHRNRLFGPARRREIDREHWQTDLAQRFSGDRRTLAPAAIIVREGQPARQIQVVQAGLVKQLKHLPNGRIRITGILRRGDLLGTPVNLGGSLRHQFSAVALTETQLLEVPHHEVERQLDTGDIFLLLRQLRRRLGEADRWIAEFSTGTVRARIARLLLRLDTLQTESPEGRLWLPTSQDMADMLGVTPESVSRVVASFKRREILHPEGAVFVCDRKALRQLTAE